MLTARNELVNLRRAGRSRCTAADVDPVPTDLAGELNRACFILTIWFSLARNRLPDPVVLCFCGRIATSDATELWLSIIQKMKFRDSDTRCTITVHSQIGPQRRDAVLAHLLSRPSLTRG